jgi:hypothetical protein
MQHALLSSPVFVPAILAVLDTTLPNSNFVVGCLIFSLCF